MKVLLLGSPAPEIEDALRAHGDDFIWRQDKMSAQEIESLKCDFLISYRHLYLLRPDILDLFPNRAVNLHSSLLPWNRGADPNFWSFLENSPKGVSIHLIDPGIDTGALVAQKELLFGPRETLRSTYAVLQREILELLCNSWHQMRQGIRATPQSGKGSFHRAKDLAPVKFLLEEKGWDTPTAVIESYGRKMRDERP